MTRVIETLAGIVFLLFILVPVFLIFVGSFGGTVPTP